MNPPTLAPAAPRTVILPNLDELDEHTPVLARKLRALDPRILHDIFNPTTTEGTK